MAETTPSIGELALQRRLLELDVLLRGEQTRWEVPKALAMILLAAAAIAAAGCIADLLSPPRPQQFVVRLEGPLTVLPHGR
jgi:hypothetical protein